MGPSPAALLTVKSRIGYFYLFVGSVTLFTLGSLFSSLAGLSILLFVRSARRQQPLMDLTVFRSAEFNHAAIIVDRLAEFRDRPCPGIDTAARL